MLDAGYSIPDTRYSILDTPGFAPPFAKATGRQESYGGQELWNPDHSINYTCFFSKKLCKNTDLCYNYPKYKQWRQKRLYSPL